MDQNDSRRTGIEELDDDIAGQRDYLRERNPAYERVLAAISELLEGELSERLETVWKTRSFGAFYERPLLLMASLRFDALREGPGHPLWPALGAPHPSADAATREAVSAAFEVGRDVWDSLDTRYVQTNETSRACVWLWPAAVLGASQIALVDIGASAGLNLIADALPRPWTLPGGAPLPTPPSVEVRRRLGYDARPLDATDPDQADWLRACIWAGDTQRLSRLETALAAREQIEVELEVAQLRDVPERLGAETFGGAPVVLAYQTTVRGYIEAAEWRDYESGMLEWLRAREPGTAVWLQLETGIDGAHVELPADITAHAAGPTAAEPLRVGRCQYHPSVVEPLRDGVGRLLEVFAAV